MFDIVVLISSEFYEAAGTLAIGQNFVNTENIASEYIVQTNENTPTFFSASSRAHQSEIINYMKLNLCIALANVWTLVLMKNHKKKVWDFTFELSND